ncbi:MAG: DUF1566 domain-containing protein [Oleibacter sp.]|nr:DUF1566 domain-containing protein [Thalassolituus sp.]
MQKIFLMLLSLTLFGLSGCGGESVIRNSESLGYVDQIDSETQESTQEPGQETFTITVISLEGGSISPATTQTVFANTTRRFTVTSNSGYGIKSVSGCGGTLLGSTYTTAQVIEDCTVSASFNEQIVYTAKLNDTGITLCGNYDADNEGQWSSQIVCKTSGATKSSNGIDANGKTVPAGQDALYGRDALALTDSIKKIGAGNAGFDFTRINSDGSQYSGNGDYSIDPWACVQDNVTDLMWEVKDTSNDVKGDSLNDADDLYNWYNSDSTNNGGSEGFENDDGNICFGYDALDNKRFCNTQAFTTRINNQGLCGASDWRMPTREELRGIVHFGRSNPSIDTAFFPNTRAAEYWSASPSINNRYGTRIVLFTDGSDSSINRNYSGHVRLVRSVQN